MDDTPQQFILKLRLNRIRRDLAYSDEAERTVTVVSMRWGITELGRLAARYREQFGELPSDTLRRRRIGAVADSHLHAGESALSARLLCPAEAPMRHNLHCGAA
jgi:AraC-like DNA-binding protein